MAIWASNVHAQDAIERIRARYTEIKQCIASMSEEDGMPPVYYQIYISQNLPGTGKHVEDIRMYYDEDEADEDVIYPPHQLALITSSYNFAIRKYYEEYLFNKDGTIAFIYARNPDISDEKEYEFRFYFDKKKLIKAIIKNRKFDDNEFVEEQTVKTIPPAYESFLQSCLQAAEKYRNMFFAIDR